jgi:hypothetical protein
MRRQDQKYEMADDAYLGAGWAVKRLKDLEIAILWYVRPNQGGAC